MNRYIIFLLFPAVIGIWASCSNKDNNRQPEHPAYHHASVQPFTDSIYARPEHAPYYFMRSEALMKIHEDSLALQDMQKAVELDSLNTRYLFAKGYLQFSLKKYPEAITTLQYALQLDPDNLNIQFLLINTYLENKRVQEAQVMVEHILRSFPDHPGALFWQAQIKAEQMDIEGAIAIAQKLLETEPNNYEVSYQLADWYREKKRPEAITQYKYTFRLDTNDVAPLFDIADMYEQEQQWKKAKEMYRECILRDPNYTDAHIRTGRILLHQDSVDKALRQFNIAISTSPVNATAYFNKGLCFEKLQLNDSARAAYRQALVFDETMKEARERWQNLQSKTTH